MAKSLNEALLEFQKNPPALTKDSKNPHFGNEYASLEGTLAAVMPKLNDLDILLTQTVSVEGDDPALLTKLTHVPTGESVEDKMLLMLERDNPQGQGSAITYARRYSLVTLLSLTAGEDDDGEAASTDGKKAGRGW